MEQAGGWLVLALLLSTGRSLSKDPTNKHDNVELMGRFIKAPWVISLAGLYIVTKEGASNWYTIFVVIQ